MQSEAAARDASGGVFLDAEALARLKSGNDPDIVAATWLATMGQLNTSLEQGLVVLAEGAGGRMRVASIWPEGAKVRPELRRATDGAVKSRHLVIETLADGGAGLAVPLTVSGQIRGAAAFAVPATDDKGLRLLIDQVQWGLSWLEVLIRRRSLKDSDDLSTVIELLATSLHHRRFREAATAVATELAGVLQCEFVAIGQVRGRHARVRALSNSANFGKRSNLVRAVEAAMDEAIDQQGIVTLPELSGGSSRVVRAHERLSETEGGASVCTVPLSEDRRPVGALLLVRAKDTPFDAEAVQLAEYAAVLLGPVLEVKRREDRWLVAKSMESAGNLLGMLIGRRHAALKLGVLILASVLAFAWFARDVYRVTANAVVEGRIQRAVTAPLGGFLAAAEARAGDVVSEGQVMARIDDRDLQLERLQWISQRDQQSREYSEAVARRERTRARILQAQIDQADAQLALLDQQMARMTIRAPVTGYVVSGDLTQALGASIDRGDVLFEVAPLDEYRVILRVDERDIRDVVPGQAGALVLSALTDMPFSVLVERITPISASEEGENVFLVEASVADGDLGNLRPGMEGVAKIEIDERRLVWIWTRRLVLWAKMTYWTWWP